MIEADILEQKLDAVREQLREVWRRRMAARLLVLTGLVALGLGLAVPWLGASTRPLALLLLVVLGLGTLLLRWRARRLHWSAVELARRIERRHPGLNALLLTAAEALDSAAPGLFQRRLCAEAAAQGAVQNWPATVTDAPRRRATRQMLLACAACLAACLWMLQALPSAPGTAVQTAGTPPPPTAPEPLQLQVTPGDVEVERGARLIVEAAVTPRVPAQATLVLSDAAGREQQRLPMRAGLEAATFGALLDRVEQDGFYQVEADEAVSPRYRITTYVHPVLERADVVVTPPAYTRLPAKEIRNTLKVTALEGSELAFTFKVNKAVQDAELFGEDKTIVPLQADARDPTLLRARLKPEATQRWRLHLVDAQERANKNPPWLSITVQANQLAKIEVVFPKRDLQVSPLQELPVEAKVWDDLSVLKSGASFSIAGRTREIVFRHGPTAPAQKQAVRELLALEGENAEPRQLVSYHFWAEDAGSQGEVRRAQSDLFFAEVRHFEDIFREAEPPPPSPGGKPQPGQTDPLVDLQKQVVNATWRLVRDSGAGRAMEKLAPDVEVVRTSEQMALDQTKQAMEEAGDAEIKAALTEAWKSMKDALDPLAQAAQERKRAPLNQALTFEQSALEWLHRAQSREHRVMRQQQNPSQAGAAQQAMRNQLMNLELKQEEQRYEEEKQAGEEQTAEQQENLQVLNRLKELARRQEALAEKIKELQKQMEQARSEPEKQELASQLQRLQEEQEQLLRDVDDLRERLEQPDNAANLAEAQQQLEQTRDQVLEAAEQLRQEQLTDAANAATRAQRELEQLQEDFKQKTARRFSEEVKQLRRQAGEVAERQRRIGEALENQKTPEASADTSAALEKMLDGSRAAREIEAQQQQLGALLESMKRLSEQAEGNNPLLHRRLYEAVRDAQTRGLEENLEEARAQSRYGNRAEAQEAERKAGTAVEQLQQGVEQAAESVLGSEAEALRLARSELDKLIEEARGQAAADPAADGGPAPARPEDAKTDADAPGQQPPTAAGQHDTAPQAPQTAEASPQRGERPTGGPGKPPDTEPKAAAANPARNAPPGGAGRAAGDTAPRPGAPGADEPESPPGQLAQGRTEGASGSANPRPARSAGANRTGGNDGGLFFDAATEAEDPRPFTGSGYQRWTDRLRNVEELLNRPELRNQAARVLDQARDLRRDHERNDAAPQVDHLQVRILDPLVELRDRVAEELAKREARDPRVPVDRDPVPPAFRDLVKRYYQELGNGN